MRDLASNQIVIARQDRHQEYEDRLQAELLVRVAGFAAAQDHPRAALTMLHEALAGEPALPEAAAAALELHRHCALCGEPGGAGRPVVTTPLNWRMYQPRMHQDCYEGEVLREAEEPWAAERVAQEILDRTGPGDAVSLNIMRTVLPEPAWPLLKKAFLMLRPQLEPTGWEHSSVPSHRSRKLRTYRRREIS